MSLKLGSTNNVDTIGLNTFFQIRNQDFIIICVILNGVYHFVYNTSKK